MMVAHPFKHRLVMNGKKAAFWIMFLWMVSISCPLYLRLTDNLKKFSDFKYALLAVVIVLTLIMYILTCLSLKKQAKSVGNKDDRQAHKFRVASEERFLRTVIIIAAIAVVSLTPATIYGQIDNHGFDRNEKSNVVNCVLMTLLCLNFSINPIIYFLRLKNYRKIIERHFSCFVAVTTVEIQRLHENDI
jgi:amino acid transporter